MDVKLTDDHLALKENFARLLMRYCPTEFVRETEPLGFSQSLWDLFTEQRGVAMGVSEEFGGDGAALLDLAIVAEECGRVLAPIPFVEAVVGARLAAQFADQVGNEHWESIRDGSSIATLAIRPFLSGRSVLVPAGAIADLAFGIDGERLVAVNVPPARIEPRPSNLGSMPLQDLALPDLPLTLAQGTVSLESMRAATDEWRVLTASALVGLAARVHEIAVEYVKVRKVFGAQLGSFQTVAHRLADDVVQIDGCRLLVQEAAWTIDMQLPSSGSFACAAFAYASDSAMRVAADCLHFHGGSGYIMEQDVQLFYRRAKAWPLALADSRAEYLEVANRIWGNDGES